MKHVTTALFAAAFVVGAGQAEAQERDQGGWWAPAVISIAEEASRIDASDGDGPWWERHGQTDGEERWDPRRSDERYDRDDDDRYDDDRYERDGRRGAARQGQRGARGSVLPFCRDGSGHPVHGMRWCAENGYARSGQERNDGYEGDLGWTRTEWEDVIFHDGDLGTRERLVRQGGVSDILGDVILGRLAQHGRQLGLDGGLDGRWVPTQVGSVLQLRMGGTALAELTDADGDGRADVVLLRRN